MDTLSAISVTLGEIDGQISDIFRALSNGFQKLDKIKDSNRKSRQLEELTDKMRDCKRLIKEFEREVKDEETRYPLDTSRMLNEKKQSMVKELNSYVALKKQYASSIENKRIDLFDGPGGGEGFGEDNVMLASSMTNQQLMDGGNRMMDETDQAIERSKKVVEETINVGAETAAALKAQTEQMSRIVNELDSIHFSIKKASKLVKEIGRQVATDRCIMALLFIIVCGVIAIIIVKKFILVMNICCIMRQLVFRKGSGQWSRLWMRNLLLLSMNTWDILLLHEGKKLITCKWVYKRKTCSNGSLECYKARLVALGFWD